MSSQYNQKNNYYYNLEKYYDSHADDFSVLVSKMAVDFNLSQNILKDAIKRSLFEVLGGGAKKNFLWTNKVPIKTKVIYYLVMALFLINILFGKRTRKSKKVKIVFDCWNINGYKFFYKPFLSFLKKNDVLLYISKHHFLFKDIDSDIDKIYSNRYQFDSDISRKIFKTQISSLKFYSNFSKKLNIDFVYLALIIFKDIALHTTTAKRIDCYVLFSAADNSFNSLRYSIYRKNGIQNIALLQNGFRTGEWANDAVDLYTYCDFYFGFGAQQIEVQKGMNCKNKIPVGSLKLDSVLKKYNKHKKKKIFDIAFLASFDEYDTAYIKVKTYNKILENLCLFKKNNPSFTIFYSDLKDIKKKKIHNKLIKDKMKSCGIVFNSNEINNSYEAIFSSRIALFYRTTIGLEAIAMSSKVLNLNYDKDMLPFSNHTYHSVLTEENYNAFENRLLFLLNSKKSDLESETKDLAYNYMNNANNCDLPKDILDIVFQKTSPDFPLG